jgi:hypothetical protein
MGALAVASAFHLLVKDAPVRLEARAIEQQARTFFGAELAVPRGTEVAPFVITVGSAAGGTTEVWVYVGPLEPEVRAAADRGVEAIGGAGFDALVGRARSLVQVDRRVDGDPRAPIVVAAVLAAVLLAPIVPPDEVTIYGVRGARARLHALGWPA